MVVLTLELNFFFFFFFFFCIHHNVVVCSQDSELTEMSVTGDTLVFNTGISVIFYLILFCFLLCSQDYNLLLSSFCDKTL